jgi:ferredoxin
MSGQGDTAWKRVIEMNERMMYVDVARCTGCGVCVGACPEGAICLVEDERGRYAQIDPETCQACEACVAACPEEAIMVQLEGELVSPEETMPVKAASRAVQPTWRVPQAVVWAGAVLAFAGREILPRVADLLVDAVMRRASGPSPSVSSAPSWKKPVVGGLQSRENNGFLGGRQRQHRQRQQGRSG